jgi:hypothetical protein
MENKVSVLNKAESPGFDSQSLGFHFFRCLSIVLGKTSPLSPRLLEHSLISNMDKQKGGSVASSFSITT